MDIRDIKRLDLLDKTPYSETALARAVVDGEYRSIVVKRVFCSSPVQCIEREFNALKHHTGRRDIVNVYGYDPKKREIYLEVIDGASIRDYIEEKGRFSLDEALPLFSDMASTLAFVHGSRDKPGFVHYDITDNNFFVRNGRSVLFDFGTSFEEGNYPLDYKRFEVGTEGFMSPEKLRCEPEFGRESDVFGLGVIFYKSVMGIPPFCKNFGNLRKQILSGVPAIPVNTGQTRLDEMVTACLDNDRKSRPSAEELVGILASV